VPDHLQIMAPFISMHQILKGIKARNLAPALAWIEEHQEALSTSGRPNNFTFQLHRLQYLHLLQTSGPKPALAYAKAHFSFFSKSHMPEIQQLMGCLLFAGRLQASPYSDLLSDSMWDAVAQDFIQQCCGLLGQVLVSVPLPECAMRLLLLLLATMEAHHTCLSFAGFRQPPAGSSLSWWGRSSPASQVIQSFEGERSGLGSLRTAARGAGARAGVCFPFDICLPCLPRAVFPGESTNHAALRACIVQTISPENCKGN